MKRIWLVLVCLALILGGCSGDSTGKIFRYDLSGPVDNLDPQFTTETAARMILGNLLEGLVIQSGEGEILPGVAESHQVSPDGLTYTFTLRQDAAWSDETPVTAKDFVFAFRRMFGSGSPFAGRFSMIENGPQILSGEAEASSLGVRAAGDHTLVITLDHSDAFFLERLTDPAAAPCSQDFFNSARGRYGLEPGSVLTNGPFRLERWDNEKYLLLRPNPHYRSQLPAIAGGVNFYTTRDAASQFLDGNADLALLSFDQQEKLSSMGASVTPIVKTVWCIVFNQDHPVFRSPLVRQGLAHTVDHTQIGEGLPLGFVPTSVLVPDAIRLMGKPYREAAFPESPLAFDTQEGKRLFEMGLSTLGRDQLPAATTILFPELAADALNMGAVQQGWQKYLAAYVNFSVESPEQIQRRFNTGDYQMLVMPFTPASSDIDSLLGAFTSGSSQNHFGYYNSFYDQLLLSARTQPTATQAAEKYSQAEKQLLSDAVIIPLYFETTYLAVKEEVRDIQASPFGDRLYFKYAQKDG